jgi:hypothetical protein
MAFRSKGRPGPSAFSQIRPSKHRDRQPITWTVGQGRGWMGLRGRVRLCPVFYGDDRSKGSTAIGMVE